jgi:hypothetical protein
MATYKTKITKPKTRRLRQKKSIFLMPMFWSLLLMVFLFVGVFYFFFFYQKFQVQQIEIAGNQKIQTQDIDQAVWDSLNKKLFTASLISFSSKNIFLIDEGNLIRMLLSKFPGIDQIFVQKKMPSGLSFIIKERQPFAVFCDNEDDAHCFSIDEKGVAFEILQNPTPDTVVIKNKTTGDVGLGKSVVDKKAVEDIAKIKKNLDDNFGLKVKEALVADPMVVSMQEGWKMYFSMTDDIDLQITKADALLKNEISAEQRPKLQYIYLQYKDRAYYK